MTKKTNKSLILFAFSLLIIVMLFSHIGCGSSGGDQQPGGSNTGGSSITVPAINALQNVELTKDVEKNISFSIDLSQDVDSSDSFSIDVEDAMNSGSLIVAKLQPGLIKSMFAMLISEAEAQLTGTVEIAIGPNSMINTVCQNGTFYGPYTVSSGPGGSYSVSPQIEEVDPYAIGLASSGPISICVRLTSPVTFSFSIGDITIDTTPSDSSGGGGGDGSGGGGGGSAGCTDVSGHWYFDVTNINSNCGSEQSWITYVIIEQSDCSLDTAWYEEAGVVKVPGSVTNDTVTIGPGDFPDDGGTTVATYTSTVSPDGSMTGSESWTWSNSSGSYCYGGTGDLTATRSDGY